MGELIAAVMAHRDCPEQLFNAVSDGWWACPAWPVLQSAELFQLLIDWRKAHPEEDPERTMPAEEKAAILHVTKPSEDEGGAEWA